MNNYKSIETLKNEVFDIRSKLSDIEIDSALGFENKKDKILQLYGIRYKETLKLFNDGFLTYGYIYRLNFYQEDNGGYFRALIIYNPDKNYELEPLNYLKIAAELKYFLDSDDLKHKRLIKQINNNENKFNFVKLPKEYFNEELVYLVTCYGKLKDYDNLKNGVYPMFINRTKSKTVLLLPDKFNK